MSNVRKPNGQKLKNNELPLVESSELGGKAACKECNRHLCVCKLALYNIDDLMTAVNVRGYSVLKPEEKKIMFGLLDRVFPVVNAKTGERQIKLSAEDLQKLKLVTREVFDKEMSAIQAEYALLQSQVESQSKIFTPEEVNAIKAQNQALLADLQKVRSDNKRLMERLNYVDPLMLANAKKQADEFRSLYDRERQKVTRLETELGVEINRSACAKRETTRLIEEKEKLIAANHEVTGRLEKLVQDIQALPPSPSPSAHPSPFRRPATNFLTGIAMGMGMTCFGFEYPQHFMDIGATTVIVGTIMATIANRGRSLTEIEPAPEAIGWKREIELLTVTAANAPAVGIRRLFRRRK